MEERKETEMNTSIKWRRSEDSEWDSEHATLRDFIPGLLFHVKHLGDLPTKSCDQEQLSDLLLTGLPWKPINKYSDFDSVIFPINQRNNCGEALPGLHLLEERQLCQSRQHLSNQKWNSMRNQTLLSSSNFNPFPLFSMSPTNVGDSMSLEPVCCIPSSLLLRLNPDSLHWVFVCPEDHCNLESCLDNLRILCSSLVLLIEFLSFSILIMRSKWDLKCGKIIMSFYNGGGLKCSQVLYHPNVIFILRCVMVLEQGGDTILYLNLYQ